MPSPLPPSDLDEVLRAAEPSFESLRGAHIFLTGATGFFGHWLLESLLHADRELTLGIHATALTRNAAAFRSRSPHIAGNPRLTLHEGDIRNFAFPGGAITYVVHAATDSTGLQLGRPTGDLAQDILLGTRHVLDFARASGARRFLYVSTGAVYGRSTALPRTPETYLDAPHPPLPAGSYEEAKLAAETLCLTETTNTPLEVVIARCFAFVGPHLPFDRHFAIGNFIGTALANQPIHIRGDGTPRRSWMYMSDLAVWLWTMLVEGAPGRAYNVGSDEAYTVAEAAHLTATTLRPDSHGSSSLPIRIDGTPGPNAPLNSYVPDVRRACEELGLGVTVPLAEALRRTAAWTAAVDVRS